MRTLDWAYATTDSTLARTVFASSCDGCFRFLDNIIDKPAAKGEHYKGGRLVPFAVAIKPNDGHLDATLVVDVTVQQSALKLISRTNKVVDSARAVKDAVFRVWLAWRDDSWVVSDWKHAVR